MDLEKVTAKIRPRRGWEAIDLGISLVQKHALVLYKIWFTISFPLFLILAGVFRQSPEWMIVIFWWLKPILERPLLHFLSRELFGEGLSAKQCITSFYSVAKIQWFLSLTLRRFSFTRSFDLPLIQLEGLKGHARTKRLRVIHSGDSGSAVWLHIVFSLVETIIYLSTLALIFLMIPDVYLENFDLWKWITADVDSNFVAFIFNFFSYLAISLVAPFYVACGFALYLNQRTHLEAWDIELAFKRLASRLSERSANMKIRLASWTSIGLIILVANIFTPQQLNAAETDASEKPEQSNLQETDSEHELNSDWMREIDLDNLSHNNAKKIIEEIKQGEDFHQMKTEEKNQYRFSEDIDEDDPDSGISSGWLVFAKIFALLIEFALWIFLAVLIIFLILKYKHLLVRGVINKKVSPKRPAKLFGLDLNSQSLPDKPWFVAKQMIQNKQYREALSLLYRASLIWYIDNSDAVIKEGYTELECLKQISTQVNQRSQKYMTSLTKNWRGLAYAHQIPELADLNKLCDQWPVVMNKAGNSQAQGNPKKQVSNE